MSRTSEIPLTPSPFPRLVILGGGFAGISLAKRLRRSPIQIVLIDRNNYHTFQPLLYQVATAGLEPDSIADPLRKQLEPVKNFYFRMAQVESIDAEQKRVNTEIGFMNYDYLVIATGSRTNYFGNDEILQKAFPLKQVPQALDLRSQILQNFEAATIATTKEELESRMNIVIVGGGPTGVEVAGALGELRKTILPRDYPELEFDKMKIVLVEGSPRLLNSMSEYASAKAYKYLRKFGVEIHLDKRVSSYDGLTVYMNDDTMIPSHTLIWAAGVQANVPEGLPEECFKHGRLVVNEFNEVKECPDVFALGDVAYFETEEFPQGLPMLAPVAIQQGEHMAKNVKRVLKNKPRIPFTYKDKGTMATVGRNKAVVDMGKLQFGGFPAWMVWMFVHLISIIGFRNKLVVFLNWVWNYFTYDKGTRLIIRKFVPGKKRTPQEV